MCSVCIRKERKVCTSPSHASKWCMIVELVLQVFAKTAMSSDVATLSLFTVNHQTNSGKFPCNDEFLARFKCCVNEYAKFKKLK